MPPAARVVLYGGHVVDPAHDIDDDLNVIIENGKIKELTKAPYEPVFFENAVDVTGCIVTPGLIDHHCHIYPFAEKIGLPGESVQFSNGVTTVIDAGSCGLKNYPKHRSFKDQTFLTYKAYINVSEMGLTGPEDLDPAKIDIGALRELFAECGDELMGLKIRTSKDIVKEFGFSSLKATVEAADQLGVPIMVHPTDPPGEMEELLSYLRPGDVCSHMYMNIGSTIVDEQGHVKECALKARERGVLFEAADAQAHFGFSTAEPAIADGFLPDFIATDGTRNSMLKHPTTYSLAMQVARYEYLGIPFKEIIRKVTIDAAKHMGLEGGYGTLEVGGVADVAVFRKHEKEVTFGDRVNMAQGQATRVGHAIYEPVVTVKSGMVVYRNILY